MPIITDENRRAAKLTKGVRATFVVNEETLKSVERVCEQAGMPPSVFYRLLARSVLRAGGPAQFMGEMNRIEHE